jgi:glyoxylase-like metal-dependent hydrolase (beta-lactamase superfamily II)
MITATKLLSSAALAALASIASAPAIYAQTATSEAAGPGDAAAPAVAAGRYTYEGHGSVNTHWIETATSLIVIDVQRDTEHAAEAIEAVQSLGKPVSAILVTHGHPDHYTGLEQFLAEWPEAAVYASPETIRVIDTDYYGYHEVVRELAPDAAPNKFVVPDHVIEPNSRITIDGVGVVTQEMGPSEATGATVFYLPATGDLYSGDLVLSGMHGFFYEERSTEVLAALDGLRVLFPDAATLHPGHGDPGPFHDLVDGQEDYTEAAREAAAITLAEGLDGKAAVARVQQALLDAYPDHGVPGGQPNMVELSAEGLLAELTRERASLPDEAAP